MRLRRIPRLVLIAIVLGPLTACADTDEDAAPETPKPPSPLAKVDIANSSEGSVPGGTTVRDGRWRVDAKSKELRVGPEPLVIGWLEFGPEVREKGGTILARGRAPGAGRLQSRFGAGLYGRNGFQVRVVPIDDEVQLVRRGVVLRSVALPVETDRTYSIELTVSPGEDDLWQIEARAWDGEQDRPAEPLIEYRIYDEELLFPLAGQAVLTATPFSGEEVVFESAECFPEGYFVEEPDSDDSEDSGSPEGSEPSD